MDDLTRGDLRLSADGSTLLVRAGDELRGVAVRDGATRWQARVAARAVAVLGDAVWALGDEGLVRVALATGAAGAAVQVPGSDGPLCATAPSSLACAGASAWVATVAADGATVRPLPACELAVALRRRARGGERR